MSSAQQRYAAPSSLENRRSRRPRLGDSVARQRLAGRGLGSAEGGEGVAEVTDLGAAEAFHARYIAEEGELEAVAEALARGRDLEELDAAVGGDSGAGEQPALFEAVDDARDVGRIAAEGVGEPAHGAGVGEEEDDSGLNGGEVVRVGDGLEVGAEALDVGEEELDDPRRRAASVAWSGNRTRPSG